MRRCRPRASRSSPTAATVPTASGSPPTRRRRRPKRSSPRSRAASGRCDDHRARARSRLARVHVPGRRRVSRDRRDLAVGASGRVRRDRRAERLRQVDAAQRRRRPAAADLRGGPCGRRAACRAEPSRDVHVPAGCAAAVEDGARQRRARPYARRRGARRRAGEGGGVDCARRPRAIRVALSGAAERRHAQARRDGAELDSRSRHRADGRAVQRARRPHAPAHGDRAARAVGGAIGGRRRDAAEDDRLRDARSRGGDRARRRRGHSLGRPRGARRRAAPRRAAPPARSAGAAHAGVVRRSLSRRLGGAARRSDQEPARVGVTDRGAGGVASSGAHTPAAQRARVLGSQVALGVVVLALWQTLVSLKILDEFFVSRPSDILQRVGRWIVSGTLWGHLAVTLEESLLGLLAGAALGISLGFALARSAFLALVLDPYIKMLNAVPRVVLAPLFLLWFGLGIWSKVALAVTLVFFVMFFNTFQGVRDADRVLIDNVRMLGATERQLVRHVLVPSALTWIFSSLQTSLGFAMVGAVVGEYLGATRGLGYVISQAEGTFDTTGVFAGMTVLGIVVVMVSAAVTRLERWLLRWKTVK